MAGAGRDSGNQEALTAEQELASRTASASPPGPWIVKQVGHMWVACNTDRPGYHMTRDSKAKAEQARDDANARHASELVRKAAPDLLAAIKMGASKNTPDFLDWVADRLVHKHGESPNVDFVLSLRERAAALRAAISKAETTR